MTDNWLSDNLLLVVVLATAAILALLLVVVAVWWTRRRAGTPAPTGPSAWGSEPYASAAPSWSQESAAPGAASAGPAAGIEVAPTGAIPTVGAGASSLESGTQMAPPNFPSGPRRSLTPSPWATPEAPPADEGGTVVLRRSPKVKVLGLLIDRKQPTRRYDLDKPTMTVGRMGGSNIVLDHPTVSREHATIKLEGDEFRVYDLGSANGTFVNGQRLREPVVLEDGMILRFGELEFTFKRMSLE
jgi:hypothetical protein